MQGDHFAAGVDCDDRLAFDAYCAVAEEPGLHKRVTEEVKLAGEREVLCGGAGRGLEGGVLGVALEAC